MRRDDNLAVHGSSNNFDNLDKAFVVFKLPGPGHIHRRVDFISAPKERYAAAVLSWSGSMMFERDLKYVLPFLFLILSMAFWSTE
jgi:DNA polymerase mu